MFKRKKSGKNQNERPGLVMENTPKSTVTEQYRTIRTNIQYSMIDKEFKSIMVTSAAASAGKSLSAANLAATFATKSKKVLLVDADLRKPSVHKTFHVPNTVGLATLITNRDMSLEETVYPTTIHNLYFLPSGPIPPNPTEMLESERMDYLKEEMEKLFDFIVFDTPPLSAVTDAQILGGKTDGTVFVIRKGVAVKENVMEAKRLLAVVDAKVIGAILNRTEKTNDDYYYYGEE